MVGALKGNLYTLKKNVGSQPNGLKQSGMAKTILSPEDMSDVVSVKVLKQRQTHFQELIQFLPSPTVKTLGVEFVRNITHGFKRLKGS